MDELTTNVPFALIIVYTLARSVFYIPLVKWIKSELKSTKSVQHWIKSWKGTMVFIGSVERALINGRRVTLSLAPR